MQIADVPDDPSGCQRPLPPRAILDIFHHIRLVFTQLAYTIKPWHHSGSAAFPSLIAHPLSFFLRIFPRSDVLSTPLCVDAAHTLVIHFHTHFPLFNSHFLAYSLLNLLATT